MSTYIRNTGLLKGIVLNTEDPVGLHRVLVRIPAIHGLMQPASYGSLHKNTARNRLWVPEDELPWADVCYPYGSTTNPEVNQVVWVTFQNGDHNFPVVIGWAGYEYTTEEEVYVPSTLI